ncbi:MAG: EF-P beta-lysylation protein EpmB [bacterium]|nr:EF-P beta-lysylation protein EpmB [bacterium]
MIPRTAPLRPTETQASGRRPATERSRGGRWQTRMAESVTDGRELVELLELDPALLAGAEGAHREFPLRVPRGFVARMRKGDPRDPLLRQVLPSAEELRDQPGFTPDPLGEESANPVPGLLHKYRGRVLLVVAGTCAVHCRYCFRRCLPNPSFVPLRGNPSFVPLRGNPSPGAESLTPALAYVASEPSIGEVILSGGDPLCVADDQLRDLVGEIARIPHVKRLRIHSRMPIVLPERVDDRLLGWLGGSRLRAVMVVHANHAREIDAEVAGALDRLRAAGIALYNQAVLLRGVNDRVAALRDLSEALFAAGVSPYYLHLLDRVRGAAHFAVAETTATRLVRELMAELSGYLVPRLVREQPGAPAKVPLCLCGQPRKNQTMLIEPEPPTLEPEPPI